jgi:tetratricopeptide (TPR) repeat protein
LLAVQARQAEQIAVAEWARAEEREAEANEQRQRADRERERAEQEKQRVQEEKKSAQAVRDFLQNDLLRQASRLSQSEALRLAGGDFALKADPTVSELLDRAAAQLTPGRIEAKFPGLPFVQAEVLKTVGDTYLEIGQDKKALDLLARAVERYRTAHGPDDAATLSARHALAVAHCYLGHRAEGRRQLEAVRDDRLRVFGPHDRETFKARMDLAWLDVMYGRPAEAATALRPLQAAAREHFGPDDLDYLLASGRLAVALLFAGRAAEAVRELEAVRDALRRLKFRPDHLAVEQGLWYLALAYKAANREGEAVALLEDSLKGWADAGDPTNPATWVSRHELAWHYLRTGDKEKAIRLFETNLAAAGIPSREALTHDALRAAYSALGRFEDELTQARKALDVLAKHYGPDHRSWHTGKFRALIGLALHRRKKYAEAEPLLVGGYREMEEHIGQMPSYDSGQLAVINRAVIDLYKATNRPAEAGKWVGKQIAALEHSLQRLGKASAKDTPDTLKATASLAQAYLDAGRKEEAFKLFQETVVRLKADGWSLDEDSLRSLNALRLAAELAGRHDLAGELAAVIVAELRKLPNPPRGVFAEQLFWLGHHWLWGDRPAEAEPPLREVLRFQTERGLRDWNFARAQLWLAISLRRQKKFVEAEPLMLASYHEVVKRVQQAPTWDKHVPALAAEQLAELYTAIDKPEEARKWQAERAKYDRPLAKPEGKK